MPPQATQTPHTFWEAVSALWEAVSNSDLFLNGIMVVVLGLFVWAFLVSRQQPIWAEAYRRLARNRMAMISLTIIGLYALIAVMDSFGATDPKTQTRKTLLDVVAERPQERHYSPPFGRETIGEPHPHPLTAPGTHPLGTDGVGNHVPYRTLKGAR